MRKTIFGVVLAAVGLALVWSFATGAQPINPTPCTEACHEQESECLSVCGEHPNPIECEEQCQDELTDCLEECS